MLYADYEISIPETAKFHKGYYDNAARDDAIYLLFSVSVEEFDTLLSSNWSIVDSFCINGELKDLLDKPIERMYSYHNEMYTYMICSTPENGFITCAFQGRYPTIIQV